MAHCYSLGEPRMDGAESSVRLTNRSRPSEPELDHTSEGKRIQMRILGTAPFPGAVFC
jgi:hypothetical protein